MELVSVDHKLQFPLLAFLLFNSNIYLQLWVNKNVIYFSGNQQAIISFIKIKNLIKNLLSINCHTYPKIQGPILPDFKKCWFLLAGVYCICWFWGMVMYGNEFKAKGNKSWTKDKIEPQKKIYQRVVAHIRLFEGASVVRGKRGLQSWVRFLMQYMGEKLQLRFNVTV